MRFITVLYDKISTLDKQDFYKYMAISLGVLLLIVTFMIYRFYRNVRFYHHEIENINAQRKEVQDILEKATGVKQQQADVNAMLEANPNFKIER